MKHEIIHQCFFNLHDSTFQRLRSERTSRLRENQNKENEICLEFVSKVIKTGSGKFQWLLLILILPENKLFHKYQVLVIY